MNPIQEKQMVEHTLLAERLKLLKWLEDIGVISRPEVITTARNLLSNSGIGLERLSLTADNSMVFPKKKKK